MVFDEVIPWGWGRKGSAPTVSGVPFGSLHSEMNRLFDDFFSDFGLVSSTGKSPGCVGFSPQVDVSETEREITVTAELPGLEEKDLDLSLSGDALILSGQKRYEREEAREGTLLRERSYGSFERRIPLNVEIDADKVEARFRNGVVTVTLPKTQEARKQVRKISVESP